MIPGADVSSITVLKDAQTSARIADLETKVAGGAHYRDNAAARMNPVVSNALRREIYWGLLALACVAALGYILFFVIT